MKELYEPGSNVKITLLKNLNKKTSLKKGNLVKANSVSYSENTVDKLTQKKALAVFTPSILTEEQIENALEKLMIVHESISHVDVLTLFGDQEHLEKVIQDHAFRDDLHIDIFTIGSSPVLETYELNEELAFKTFINEFID